MTSESARSLAWSWKRFANEFLEFYGQEKKKKQKNQTGLTGSIILSFLIIFITAQTLSFVYDFVENKPLLKEYKGANVIVYGNIG